MNPRELEILQALAIVGPVVMKHPDGRFGVLWHHKSDGSKKLGLFPLGASGDLAKALAQPDEVVSTYSKVSDVLRSGWRLD